MTNQTQLNDDQVKDLQSMAKDLRDAHIQSKKFIEEMDRKIAEIDIRYAQLLLKEDMQALEDASELIKKRGY